MTARSIRLLAVSTVLSLLSITGITLSMTGTAFAVNSAQWCSPNTLECYNAWNGGPNIKDYTYISSTPNNNEFSLHIATGVCNNGFTTTTCPTGWGVANDEIVNIQLNDSGSKYNGDYIGDLNNSSTNAQAGLNKAGAWGSNFVIPTGGCTVFWNTHWRGYLGDLQTPKGNQQYLNNVSPECSNEKTP